MVLAILDSGEGEGPPLALAMALADRGHEVSLLASHEGRRETFVTRGVSVTRGRRVPGVLLDRRSWEPDLAAVPAVVGALLRGRFDAAHTSSHVLGWACLAAGRRLGSLPPLAFQCVEPPTREFLVAARSRLDMYLRLARQAPALTAAGEDAAAAFEQFLMRRPQVVPAADVEQIETILQALAAR
jgi:hypothetical protein